MARFFIDRPVFAIVLAIIITLLGTIAGFSLPIAQYFIKKESLCSLCTLIDPKYIFIHIISPVPLLFLRCLLHLIHNNQTLLWMFL